MNDRHHILHHRQEWTLRPEAEALRESRLLVPRIPRVVHNEIHRTCPPVPALGYYALRRTLAVFEPGENTLESMDNLMLAMESAAANPRAHELERQLIDLVIQSVDLQRPLLQEALTERVMV